MHYDYTAIVDTSIPAASAQEFEHLLQTYASETNKVVGVWRAFSLADLDYRPHPRASSVADILKHQLLSERRFFGEFLGTPEPPPGEVLPAVSTPEACAARLVALARPRLHLVVRARAFLRCGARTRLDLLASRFAYGAPSHATYCLLTIAGPKSAFDLWPHSGCYMARRRSNPQRGGRRA